VILESSVKPSLHCHSWSQAWPNRTIQETMDSGCKTLQSA